MNLISNAIKYAAGKPIQVSVSQENDLAILKVRDNGPGIAEAELSRIFERFERASSTRHYGGLGLGLYVAHQIAKGTRRHDCRQQPARWGCLLHRPIAPQSSTACAAVRA